MDAKFWADAINNLFGAIGLLFGQSVSDQIVSALEGVTKAGTLLPNPDAIVPFVQAIGALALIMSMPVAVVNLIVGAITNRAGFIKRAAYDVLGTTVIAVFGLTGYSLLMTLVNAVNSVITEVAKVSISQTQGNWYDGILSAWNVANPVSTGFNLFVSQVGGWLLVNQMLFLNLIALPSILLLMLAYIFRENMIARAFMTIALVLLTLTLLARVAVALWLAICAWMFTWVPASMGIPQATLLGITLGIAGCITPGLFIIFLTAATIVRVKGITTGKNKDAEKAEEEKVEAAQKRATTSPSAQPSYDSSTSSTVMEKGKAYMQTGREYYEKGRGYYDKGVEGAEKTKRTAHTVVMVATAVESIAPAVAVKFASVPYVAPIAAGVGVAAAGTKTVASRVEKSADRVLDADRRIKDTFSC